MSLLFVPDKQEYIKKREENKGCLFCRIINKEDKNKDLSVFIGNNFIISLNLYPYNPGHLLIFPKEHIEDIREISEEKFIELKNLIDYSLKILEDLYQPKGFNIGFNIGEFSGASVMHLHLHIVPRYSNEVGFIDLLSGTRIIVQHPKETKEKISSAFKKIFK